MALMCNVLLYTFTMRHDSLLVPSLSELSLPRRALNSSRMARDTIGMPFTRLYMQKEAHLIDASSILPQL